VGISQSLFSIIAKVAEARYNKNRFVASEGNMSCDLKGGIQSCKKHK
jgi:hypothetical protein